MKITAFIIFAFCIQVSATTLAQNVTLSELKAPLEKVINEIKRQTGYSFFYNQDWLQQAQPVDVQVKNAPLETVLKTCFSNQPFDYAIVNKTIVLKLKEKPVEKRDAAVPITVTGRITDTLGTPLIGATILIKGTTKATITNENGEFSIPAQTGDWLVVSFIGYKNAEISVGEHSPQISNLQLRPLISGLKEVVVSNGYQALPLERSTGSYDHIDNKLFNREVSPDIISRLQGIANSVYFDQRYGQNQITIRGYSTFTSGNSDKLSPLIVVDNFPYDGLITNINPNDVESITILKDAAAASIWGAKAGNGVIVITTRKGQKNRPVSVEVNSNVTVSEKPHLYDNRDFINSSAFIDIEKFLYSKGFYDDIVNDTYYHPPVSPVVTLLDSASKGLVSQAYANKIIDGYRSNDIRKDLLKYFYQHPIYQQYSINLSGGTDKTGYFFSAGDDHDALSQVGSNNQRYTINSSVSYNPIKNLQIVGSINYAQSQNSSDNTLKNISTGGQFGGGIYPYAKLADNNGNPLPIVKDYATSFVQGATQHGFLNWQFYPLQELRNGYNTNLTNNYDTRINLDVNYTIVPGLIAEGQYQYEKGINDYSTLATVDSYEMRNKINLFSAVNGDDFASYMLPPGGRKNYVVSTLTSKSSRGSLHYNKNWGPHAISVLGGFEARETRNEETDNALYGYDPSAGTSQAVDYKTYYDQYPYGSAQIDYFGGIAGTVTRFTSEFANAAYTYDNRYTVTGSARRDASNLFGVSTNDKVKPLWSAGVAYQVSNEHFYHSTLFPMLKIRASYGHSGNVDNSVAGVTTIAYQGSGADFSGLPSAGILNYPNPNLRWENVAMLNLGLDFGIKNNILSGSIEYFTKATNDIISGVPLDPSSGTNFLNTNSASLSGHGLDIQLNSQNLNGKLKWTSNLIFSYYKDKVTKIYSAPGITAASNVGMPLGASPKLGYPLGSVFAFKWAGLDPQTGDPRGYLNGQVSKDYGSILNAPASTLFFKGSGLPLYYGNIRNTFSYEGVSLSANIAYRFKYWIQKTAISYGALYNWGGNVDYYNRWQKPGDEQHTTVPSMIYPYDGNRDTFYGGSEPNFIKGDNIKLKDISLSYDIPIRGKIASAIKGVNLYFYANNLAIIWKANKDGIDPDLLTSTQIRSYSIGCKIKL